MRRAVQLEPAAHHPLAGAPLRGHLAVPLLLLGAAVRPWAIGSVHRASVERAALLRVELAPGPAAGRAGAPGVLRAGDELLARHELLRHAGRCLVTAGDGR